ncbi:MAG: glycosyltransferase [Candidatus Cloacimonetes bacterium]|nr:glycosyltransferase [Candidatus Cloacimonadota bacterium]
MKRNEVKTFAKRRYSILVACRNEEENIENLFAGLRGLNYPVSMFEVIIVDDASSDGSWLLLQQEVQKSSNISVFRLEEKSLDYKGKKAALKFAAARSAYEYFLFTDADCLLPPDLLTSYNKKINDNTGAVIGWYITRNSSNLQRIVDFTTAMIFALSVYLDKAFSASGMNWVVSRQAFEKVGGYEKIRNIVAGDDKLLLLLVKKAGYRINFNQEYPVSTKINREMSRQRMRRKYGKFASNPLPVKLSIILVASYLLSMLISMFRGQFDVTGYYIISMCLIWLSGLWHFQQKFRFTDLAVFLFFPYLALYYTIAGSLGNWEWKDQYKSG